MSLNFEIFLMCSLAICIIVLIVAIKIFIDKMKEDEIKNKYGSDFKKSADEYFDNQINGLSSQL